MVYLLDTNIVSLLVRDDVTIVRWLGAVGPGDDVLVPVIVLGEVRFGLRRLPAGRRRDELQRRLDGVLAGLAVQGLPDGAAGEYARIKADMQGRGQALGDNDCWMPQARSC
jgi:predicted nucleic acid-binding protein